MKVLIFSTAYLPLVGGAEISVRELTDRMSGIEFDLITARLRPNLPKFERVGVVNVHRLGFGIEMLDKLLVPFLGAWKAWWLNREKKYDYFWCVMASFASGAAYIANWFQKKVPIILTLQEGDSEKWLRYRWFGLIDLSWRLALKNTDHLTALSNYLLERARRLGYRGKSYLVPNGVDIKRFQIVKHSVFDKSAIKIITTSRLVEKNGVGDIIEALGFLPENVHLKVIGSGSLEEVLKLKADRLQVGHRVEFLGEIQNSDISKYLSEADVFVRPSLSEGQGISFIEAMASGLPVVATPVGGIPDFLEHEETGLFCKVSDPKSIADVVERLIHDELLRKRLVENARKMVEEKYDWDLIAREMRSKVFGT